MLQARFHTLCNSPEFEGFHEHNIMVPELKFLINLYTGFNKPTMSTKELKELEQKILNLPAETLKKTLKNCSIFLEIPTYMTDFGKH